jgi:aryl-alcohol dehydrogenase-like predicted oxidoreductase
MESTRLGTSGLRVSRIALGCMSFGTPSERMPWTLDDAGAEPIFRQALELGVTFWDTANVYGSGTSASRSSTRSGSGVPFDISTLM